MRRYASVCVGIVWEESVVCMYGVGREGERKRGKEEIYMSRVEVMEWQMCIVNS